jgi:TPR repeat protein
MGREAGRYCRGTIGRNSPSVYSWASPEFKLDGIGRPQARRLLAGRTQAASRFAIARCGAPGLAVRMKRLLALLLALGLVHRALAGGDVAEIRAKAEQNDPVAQKDLGILYANGTGVPKDSAEAVKWLRRAAEQGNAPAQKNLGLMYANGTGVAKDSAEAVKWFRKAAEQGYPKALFRMGAAYESGVGVPRDSTEALKWFRKAAERGDAATLAYLGQMHTKGTGGVPVDLVRAHTWLSIAAAKGHENARDTLVKLEAEMTAGQITEARQLARAYFDGMPGK